MFDPEKLRIMFVVQSLVKGGAERMVLEISRELQRRKVAEILIVGFDNRNEYPGLSEGLRFIHAPVTFQLSVFGHNQIEIQQLTRLINDFKPDIIHTNCYMQEAPPREVIYPGIKYFSHLHDNMPAFRKLKLTDLYKRRRLTEYYEKRRLVRSYKKCKNTFIAISENTRKYYDHNLPKVLADKIVMLPNAIDYQKFYHNNHREISDKVNLVMVGHMSDNKNQIFLIDVLQKLRNTNVNAYLTLIGDWRNNGVKIETKAKNLGLEPYLSMPGIIENIENNLKEQHVYVHSAHYEPFGLVMVEAMAAGLPVVCLDGGGNRDIIEDGKNGFMVYEQNAEKFADKIIQFTEDQMLYQSMSNYAREYAKKYDIKSYVDKLLSLYTG